MTNAAYGSNLNMEGIVECDASVMAQDGTFGAIAAASGILNPISAAVKLAEDSKEPLSHGRVRPHMIAGDAARRWAQSSGLATAMDAESAAEMHITKQALAQHKKYIDLIKNGGPASLGDSTRFEKKRKRAAPVEPSAGVNMKSALADTVGCVVVSYKGEVAAGVSSGGIAVKYPGRVGEAAVVGAGCWAHAQRDIGTGCHRRTGVAASVTGVGERVMKHLVARECAACAAENVRKGKRHEVSPVADACAEFLKHTVLAGPSPNECGVLCVTTDYHCHSGDPENDHPEADDSFNKYVDVELGAVHGAQSMAVAYAFRDENRKMTKDAAVMRRQDGETVQSMAIGIKWENRAFCREKNKCDHQP